MKHSTQYWWEMTQHSALLPLLAFESGQNAFGSTRPDLPRQLHLLYLSPAATYLQQSLSQQQETVDLLSPPDASLGSWDLHSALRLLLRANPELVQVLHSHPVWQGDTVLASQLAQLAQQSHVRIRQFYHQRQSALQLLRSTTQDAAGVLGCLHALLSLYWLASQPGMPPQDWATLAASLPPALLPELNLALHSPDHDAHSLPPLLAHAQSLAVGVRDLTAPEAGHAPDSSLYNEVFFSCMRRHAAHFLPGDAA